jgi:phage gp36-like protein
MYATQTDLERRFGTDAVMELSDRTLSGVADADVIAHALDDAASIIDGYLAGRYALPLAFTPKLLRVQAEAIAFYLLHRNGAPDAVVRGYQDALQTLKNLSTGVVRLTVPDTGVDPAPNLQGDNVIVAEGGPAITSDLGRF